MGAGRKSKALAEKIENGNPGGRKLTVLEVPDLPDIPDLPVPPEMEGVNMPPPSEFLSAVQRDGSVLGADVIYIKVCRWLSSLGCEKLVTPQMVEQYAMSVARWQQCEEAVSRYGHLGKHPSTGAPIQSPYVAMSQNYNKQANQIWFQIYQIVKENCSVEIRPPDQEADMMEQLLRSRKG